MNVTLNTQIYRSVRRKNEFGEWEYGYISDNTSVSVMIKWGTDTIPTEHYAHEFDEIFLAPPATKKL